MIRQLNFPVAATLALLMLWLAPLPAAASAYADYVNGMLAIVKAGDQLRNQGNTEGALAKYRETLRQSAYVPEDVPQKTRIDIEMIARMGILLTLADAKRWQDMLEEATIAIPVASAHDRTQYQNVLAFKTKALLELGRLEEAEVAAAELSRIGAPYGNLIQAVAKAKNERIQRGQQEEGIVRQAIERGAAAEEAGRLNEALDIYSAAMAAMAPNFNGVLAEHAIAVVQRFKAPPAIPEEARKRAIFGQTAMKDAKSPDDFKRAVAEYMQALLLAPWWADLYVNLGIVLEQMESYPEALIVYRLYLKAAPNAPDREAMKNKLYELEYRTQQSGKRN